MSPLDLADADTIDGLLERRFTLDGVPGLLWTPVSDAPTPLILLGHPGGLDGMRPRLAARARRAAADGFATAALELPGSGDRPRIPGLEAARSDLRAALAGGRSVDDGIVDRLVLPLVEHAVPEWQGLLDELLALPGLRDPVGISGGPIAVALRLAVVEPRLAAAGLFAGSYVPRAILGEAPQVTIPVHVLLQWDDVGNDRRRALDLFDALGSPEKTLQANLGGHTGVPDHAGEDAARFFARLLA